MKEYWNKILNQKPLPIKLETAGLFRCSSLDVQILARKGNVENNPKFWP